MYSAVAPPSALNEGVTVHKDPDDEPKGRVSKEHLDRLRQARAKNQALTQQLAREANRKPKGTIQDTQDKTHKITKDA